MREINRMVFLSLGWLGLGMFASTAEPLSPEQFAKAQALIKPSPDEEAWAKIPWLTGLWQAREIAAKEGKPILLWEMDGHPLGCV
ncbi:MAG: hypothetical protein EXR99_10955 [Gemmataceae bacterium]|nr:hypothetical protein [Gemmataceae bacterium]